MKYGFITYIKPEVTVKTAQELFDDLTAQQKVAILNEYANNGNVNADILRLKALHKIQGAKIVVPWLFKIFEGMRTLAVTLCRGEFVVSETTDPETGEVTKEYNPIPQDAEQLALGLALEQYGNYGQYLSSGEITYFVNTMVSYAKQNEAENYVGTWEDYFGAVTA